MEGGGGGRGLPPPGPKLFSSESRSERTAVLLVSMVRASWQLWLSMPGADKTIRAMETDVTSLGLQGRGEG